MCSANDTVTGKTVKCPKCGKPFAARPTLDGQSRDTKKSRPGADADPFPTLPAEFGRYRVLNLLGRGGMGAVYLAQDSQLGRKVALKIPFIDGSDAKRVERFAREGRSAAALHHPNICTVFDAGAIGGRPYITMAYLAGTPLDRAIDPDEPMPPRRAAEVARGIALALAYAHENGVVHRDLKPANVMLTPGGQPVVMDFGLAKMAGDVDPNEMKLTRQGGLVGTPSYMAPEQVRGDVGAIGPATDIYALGVVLFEMLAGRPPYSGSLAAVLGQILAAPVPSVREFRPGVESWLDDVCRRAMAKDPAGRFAGMAEFADALDLDTPVPVPEPEATAPPAPPVQAVRAEPVVRVAVPAPAFSFDDLAGQEPPPRERKPKARVARPAWRRPAAVALGVLLPLMAVLAAVVFRLETANGTLVVEVDDPAVEARIKDGRVILSGPDGNDRYTLAPGERDKKIAAGPYRVRVEGADGLALDTTEFTLKKGDKVTVRVTAESDKTEQVAKGIAKPPQPPPVAPAGGLDALRRDTIAASALSLAGDGDPKKASAKLVGVLGEVEPIHSADVVKLAFSPDGKLLASASLDKTVILRDTATGRVKQTFKGHTGPVWSVGFGPGGRELITASDDGTIRVWPIGVGPDPTVIEADLGRARTRLAVTPDGNAVAAGGEAGLIKVWQWGKWKTPTEITALKGKLRILSISLSPDGTTVACGVDREQKQQEVAVRLFSASDGEPKGSFEHPVRAVYDLAFSHDGRHLAAVGYEGDSRVWEAGSGKLVSKFGRDYLGGEWPNSYSVAWSPDDKTLAVGGHAQVNVYDASTGNKRLTKWDFTGHIHGLGSAVAAVAFSPAGDLLAAGGNLGDVPVWDTATWARKHLERGHTHHVRSVAVSPDGQELLTLGDEAAVFRWPLTRPAPPVVRRLDFGNDAAMAFVASTLHASRDGKVVLMPWLAGAAVLDSQDDKPPIVHTGSGPLGGPHLGTAALAPDGGTMAVESDTGVCLWNLSLGRKVHTFQRKGPSWLTPLSFSGDGKYLSACEDENKRGVVWDVASGTERCSWENKSPARASAFHPQGKSLATGHADGSIFLRDPATGQVLRTLAGHPAQVRKLKFSPDGNVLISSGDDGCVCVWTADRTRAREVIPVGPVNKPLTFDIDPSGRYVFVAGRFQVVFVLKI